MPIDRKIFASHGATYIERIWATSPGEGWGSVHEAKQWRLVLPGKGSVHWRNQEELIYVDALTTFRLAPGDTYQLRHERERAHHVMCSDVERISAAGHRAWLLRPLELFTIKRTLAQLRRGESEVETLAGATVSAALARAFPLPLAPISPFVLLARHRATLVNEQHLKLEELAEEVRCSTFHLIRLFRRDIGVSPHQYQLHLRLASALQRLEEAETSISDLAFELGFSSHSHFGEAFRRFVGCTPGQARLALR